MVPVATDQVPCTFTDKPTYTHLHTIIILTMLRNWPGGGGGKCGREWVCVGRGGGGEGERGQSGEALVLYNRLKNLEAQRRKSELLLLAQWAVPEETLRCFYIFYSCDNVLLLYFTSDLDLLSKDVKKTIISVLMQYFDAGENLSRRIQILQDNLLCRKGILICFFFYMLLCLLLFF